MVSWAVPFAVSVLLFGVRETNRALFESLITVLGVSIAVSGALYYFRGRINPMVKQGVILGFA